MGTLVPMAAAKPFFDALFLDVVGPDARIVVFALPDRRSESFDSTEAAAEYAVSRAGDSDVYFGCGLYRPGIKAGRGEAADVVGITAVWADIDCGTGHKKNVPPDEDSARRVLDSIGIKPSILVDSGHGLHAYWRLTEFTSVEDGAADLARRWCGHVQAVARALGGWALDSVGDLPRVLRVPGTMNHKADPRPVRLLTQLGETVPRYHSDELLDLCAKIPEAASTEPPVIAESLALDPNAAPPAEKLAAFIENDTKFRRTWEHDRPDLKDQSPSAYDQSLASQAASAGWTEQETANLLIAFRRKTGADVTKTLRPDYMQRTIGTGGAGNNGSPKANSEPKDPPLVWEPFPTHVLPEAVRSFITAASKAIGCDDSMVALPLLAGLASAIGTTRRIRLKRKWCEPSILWTAIIAGSGQLKSPAFDIALEPICKRQ